MTLARLGAAGAITGMLAACSGGSGPSDGPTFGTSGPVPFTSFSDLPDTGEVRLSGEAIQAPLTIATNGDVSIGPSAGTASATAIIETESGGLVAVTLDRAGNQVVFDSRTGDTFLLVGGTLVATAQDNSSTALVADANGSTFEYQTFGSWFTGLTGTSGTVNAATYGARTPDTGMPAGGSPTATFTGASSGAAQLADGTAYSTVSDFTVTTDFTNATITSANTEGADLNSTVTALGPLPDLDFSGTGPVSGSRFTAPVTGTNSPTLSGSARGQFYGPGAEEVGGTFSATDGAARYIGAFGAAQ